MPTPSELVSAWVALVRDEGLLYELSISMRLNVEAILLSTIISVGLAYVAVDRLGQLPVRVLSKFRFFGMTGFVIIFMRVFGGGHALKVALLVFGMSVFFITSMLDVVSSTTRAELDHARVLNMSKWRAIYEVIILGKADQTFDALRQNAAIGWMMLTMVESLVKFEGGVGVIMLNESKYRNLGAVVAAQLTVLIVGIAQDKLIAWLKGLVCPHARLVLEER
jgi:NitT/TauT family transport system permease protein